LVEILEEGIGSDIFLNVLLEEDINSIALIDVFGEFLDNFGDFLVGFFRYFGLRGAFSRRLEFFYIGLELLKSALELGDEGFVMKGLVFELCNKMIKLIELEFEGIFLVEELLVIISESLELGFKVGGLVIGIF
jgi:hypothetical protein